MRMNTQAWGPSSMTRPRNRSEKRPRRRSITSLRKRTARRVGSADPAPTAARGLHPIQTRRSHSLAPCVARSVGTDGHHSRWLNHHQNVRGQRRERRAKIHRDQQRNKEHLLHWQPLRPPEQEADQGRHDRRDHPSHRRRSARGRDAEAAKSRILAAYDAHDPPPSIVIDSGNGLQGVWLLDTDYLFPELPAEREARVSEIELRNMALARALGTTPGTHNVERLPRLPGTSTSPTGRS